MTEAGERRNRGATLRLAGAGLVSVLAFGIPMDGNGGVYAGGPVLLPRPQMPDYTTSAGATWNWR